MQNFGHVILTISTLLRQFFNCWLEYVLSQPVDLDLSVMFHFLRSYFGLDLLHAWISHNKAIVDESFAIEEQKDVLPELVPQESYS